MKPLVDHSSCLGKKIKPRASMIRCTIPPPPRGDLTEFRQAFYQCLTTRADALFELTDAVLCAEGPVTSLVELSLAAEHRRGHGSLYDGLNHGQLGIGRVRNLIARQSIPRCDEGRIVLAIDVSHWLRPDANTSPQRLLCHTYGRGKGQAQMISGWPYSFFAALEPGRSSWTAVLDVMRVSPDGDYIGLAATQLRTVVEGLVAAGQWRSGDPEIWIIGDSGCDGPRLAFLLADLPVRILVRLCSDRVLRFPAPPREPGTRGRSVRHGTRFEFTDPATWPAPAHITSTDTSRHGAAPARSWDRLHTKLTRVGRVRGVAADPGGHGDPVTGRAPAGHGLTETVAVVVSHDRDWRGAGGSVVADVPASFRRGTHFPVLQADVGLDQAPRPGPAGG
jgi:hypothetical protein